MKKIGAKLDLYFEKAKQYAMVDYWTLDICGSCYLWYKGYRYNKY